MLSARNCNRLHQAALTWCIGSVFCVCKWKRLLHLRVAVECLTNASCCADIHVWYGCIGQCQHGPIEAWRIFSCLHKYCYLLDGSHWHNPCCAKQFNNSHLLVLSRCKVQHLQSGASGLTAAIVALMQHSTRPTVLGVTCILNRQLYYRQMGTRSHL